VSAHVSAIVMMVRRGDRAAASPRAGPAAKRSSSVSWRSVSVTLSDPGSQPGTGHQRRMRLGALRRLRLHGPSHDPQL